tara:strand:+ start:103899 stop:104186 length:288 start_codon:yes stop_codon:yes gene_type:complete
MALIMAFSTTVHASIAQDHYTGEPDPVKKKAVLIQAIKHSLSETQALLLKDYLHNYTVEDLEYIKEDAKEFEKVLRGLENRAPDDEDEHGVSTTQ